MITIKQGALFISDAHDNAIRDGFYQFLVSLENGNIKTSQLFLMGDMFDLLVGEISYTRTHYQKSIDLINKLSNTIQIIYFEGNHDYNLTKLFPLLTVIPIALQPIICTFSHHTLYLSHGDIYQDKMYIRYTKIIRNPYLLKSLNILDIIFNNFLSKKILFKQKQKSICHKQKHFLKIIKQKIQKYDIGVSKIDFICEGHHHQNEEFIFESLKYKNFSSFACDRSYYQISLTDQIIFKEVLIKG